ncbi:leucyl/phenylalanyl-tRNA--protein transferase [Qipengyuania sp. MTN3-11]|uniref:leucyl/phenylalanyl-tRNA--protein transferase n=1 Tax=Qipengyuania sp. MTN3-11 TaxID=3056557 RepID=UPI0036F38F26
MPAQPVPPELLLSAYRAGIFPMADHRDDPELFWVEPRSRAIIPLESFRPSRSLRKTIRCDRFRVTCDADFPAIIAACAEPREEHAESWISHRIEASYLALYHTGHAHSFECWLEGKLVGGLYGVAFDRVFCGESMFSRVPDASKVALAWLVACMRAAGYRLLDCQFMTDHLQRMGAVSMPQSEYLERLKAARGTPAASLPETWHSYASACSASSSASSPSSSPGKSIAQSFTQTS